MQEPDTDPPRKGKALTALSVAIIAYVWAGGHFTDRGMLGGGLIRIEREYVPEYVAVILFSYYFLRFLSPIWNPWARSGKSVRKYMHRDTAFHKNVIKTAHAQLEVKNVRYKGQTGGGRLAVWESAGERVTNVAIPDKGGSDRFREESVTLTRRDITWPWLKGLLKTCLFQDTFREDLLPLLLASGAIVCIVGRVVFGW